MQFRWFLKNNSMAGAFLPGHHYRKQWREICQGFCKTKRLYPFCWELWMEVIRLKERLFQANLVPLSLKLAPPDPQICSPLEKKSSQIPHPLRNTIVLIPQNKNKQQRCLLKSKIIIPSITISPPQSMFLSELDLWSDRDDTQNFPQVFGRHSSLYSSLHLSFFPLLFFPSLKQKHRTFFFCPHFALGWGLILQRLPIFKWKMCLHLWYVTSFLWPPLFHFLNCSCTFLFICLHDGDMKDRVHLILVDTKDLVTSSVSKLSGKKANAQEHNVWQVSIKNSE